MRDGVRNEPHPSRQPVSEGAGEASPEGNHVARELAPVKPGGGLPPDQGTKSPVVLRELASRGACERSERHMNVLGGGGEERTTDEQHIHATRRGPQRSCGRIPTQFIAACHAAR